jgi:glycosyltransferase involved in cell wall biosynthesis
MRIGIDARMYGPEQGGLGRYIEQLISELQNINKTDEFFIFLRHENWNIYSPQSKNFHKILADVPWYGWREQLLLPKIFNRLKLDLLHFPHWNIPIFYRKPFVVTIHDLLLLKFPTKKSSTLNFFSYWFKNACYRIVLRNAIRNAKQILTVSNFSKSDIKSIFKIPENKITVTHLAPFEPKANTKTNETEVLKKYQIKKPFIMYVGVAYPHKNLAGLLEAWKICKAPKNDFSLVLVGKKNFFYQKILQKITKEKIANVIYTDFVPDEELSVLYKNCSAYIMPSFYEGSALPSLEALFHKIPVISSHATCLPEILKNAAYYFDPTKPTEIASAIETVLGDQEIQKNLIQNGQKIYTEHSWKEVATKTLEIYQKNSG